MKKLLFIALFAFTSVAFAQKQQNVVLTSSVKSTSATMKWLKTEYDFGKIAQNKPVVAEFEFKNTGNVPVIISNAKGGCGCTGVEYPQEAIAPGKSGKIKATYNAKNVGGFNKNVSVESNAGSFTLFIKGEVVAE